jgi:hypothetical protein
MFVFDIPKDLEPDNLFSLQNRPHKSLLEASAVKG